MRILALVCLVPALTCQVVSYEVFFLKEIITLMLSLCVFYQLETGIACSFSSLIWYVNKGLLSPSVTFPF